MYVVVYTLIDDHGEQKNEKPLVGATDWALFEHGEPGLVLHF